MEIASPSPMVGLPACGRLARSFADGVLIRSSTRRGEGEIMPITDEVHREIAAGREVFMPLVSILKGEPTDHTSGQNS